MIIRDRLARHFEFVEDRIQKSGPLKYTNYGCPVDEPGTVHFVEWLKRGARLMIISSKSYSEKPQSIYDQNQNDHKSGPKRITTQ